MGKSAPSHILRQKPGHRQALPVRGQKASQPEQSTQTPLKPRTPPKPHHNLVAAIGARKVASTRPDWSQKVLFCVGLEGARNPPGNTSGPSPRHQHAGRHQTRKPPPPDGVIGTPLTLLRIHEQWLGKPSRADPLSAPISGDAPSVSQSGTAQGEAHSGDPHTEDIWAWQPYASTSAAPDGSLVMPSEDPTCTRETGTERADLQRDDQVLSSTQATSYTGHDSLVSPSSYLAYPIVPQQQQPSHNDHTWSSVHVDLCMPATQPCVAPDAPGSAYPCHPSITFMPTSVPWLADNTLGYANTRYPWQQTPGETTVHSQTQNTDNRTAQAVQFNTGCITVGLCTDSAHVQSSHPSNQPTTLRLQTSSSQAVNYGKADPLQGIMAPDLVLGHWAARADVQHSHLHVDNEDHFRQTSPANPWMTAGYQDLASLSATRAPPGPCVAGDTTASSYSPPDVGRPGIADGQYWSPWNDKHESTHQIDQGGASAHWGFF
ncbi:hypothetical protein BC628DRAFT_1340571 [Trametes gibbosa]|nr:hypothetical protein BC628DRAFT_1340571 [Trametes gibbosa]